MHRLAPWLPPIAWMGVVLWLSTGAWSAEHTHGVLAPLLARLLPAATPAQVAALHALVRKLAHVTEYAILALLWRRALVREGVAPGIATWAALAVSVGWALVDEAGQATRPSRTGSPVDVVIDGAGAALGLVAAARGWRGVVDRTATVLLWCAAVGGVVVLVIDTLAGVPAIAPWLTTPVAVLMLALRWRRDRRASARN